jgi:hypothetical protein
MRFIALVSVAGVLVASSALIAQRNAQTVPDAVKADPAHYKVELENDLVRMLRIKYGPGEKSVMHSHPAGCATFLVDQTFTFTMPDGKTQDDVRRAGEVSCGDAEVHLPQNTGRGTAEVILVEFKNRRTVK